MDRDEIVVALALAALAGNAGGIRIEGAARVAAVRRATSAPIIGIVKRDLLDSPVRITPFEADITALANAGADIIAVDATSRVRPVSVANLLASIHAYGKAAMADTSTLDEALAAEALGFDIIGTTLSGYTGGAVPEAPDLPFIAALAAHGKSHGRRIRIMAEGRFNTPMLVRAARDAGAWSVTVGSAITRTEVVTQWFVDALV